MTINVKRFRSPAESSSRTRAAASPAGPDPSGRDEGWRESHAILMRIARTATPGDFPRREFQRTFREFKETVLGSKLDPSPGRVAGIVTIRGVLADGALMAALLDLAGAVNRNPLFAAGEAEGRIPDVRRQVMGLLEAAMTYSSKWP
jgi:hypothetical protein